MLAGQGCHDVPACTAAIKKRQNIANQLPMEQRVEGFRDQQHLPPAYQPEFQVRDKYGFLDETAVGLGSFLQNTAG